MSARSETLVILASAGTGKTWQLTNHFLRLVVDGERPDGIVASTFTRKAAGEILGRLFERLADAAEGEAARAELSEALGRELDRAALLELLARLGRRIHRFRVETLDALFLRLVRGFAHELGLPGEAGIVEEVEDERLRAEALSEALGKADQGEWISLQRRLQSEDVSRSVHRTLMRVIEDAYGYFEESDEAAWSFIQPPPEPPEAELESALHTLEGFETPRNRNGKPNANWAKYYPEVLAALAGARWGELLEKGLVKKVAQGEASYFGHDIPAELASAVATTSSLAAHHIGQQLLEQNRASYRLLEDFDREYGRLSRARGALRFDHLPRTLAPTRGSGWTGGTGGGSLPGLEEIGYRLGAGIEHLLLDEFQDTSPPQWRVLQPIVDALRSGKGQGRRSLFVVGDPKQAIYAFRNAEPRLLRSLVGHLGVKPRELHTSFRSSQVVLDLVNRVFGTLERNDALLARDGEQRYGEVVREFSEGWIDHRAAKDLPGFARLTVVPKGEDGAVPPAMELAAERAAQLHTGSGGGTVAILLRRNKHIPTLIHLLRQRGIAASGEGGNQLTDSAAVEVALSLLWFADHPDDSAAQFHVASSPLGAGAGLTEPLPEDAQAARRVLRRQSRGLRRRIAERGAARVLTELRPAVGAGYGAWDQRRFDQLLELAILSDELGSLRPSELVERVRRERVEDPTGAGVKVMTVHGAKGLEFEAVILPELDTRMRGTRGYVARRRNGEPSEPLEAVSRYARGAERQLIPGLEELHEDDRRRDVTEELCNLYVAMTRAIHHLELIVPEGGDPTANFAGILRAALGLYRAVAGEEHVLGGEDELAWAVPGEAEEAPRAGAAPAPEPRLRLGPSRAPRERVRRSPSLLEGGRRVSTRELFASDRSRSRGRVLHAWLEAVEWLEEFDISDEELADIARALGPVGPELELERAQFRGSLQRPGLAGLLSRETAARRLGCAPEQLEVLRERRFALPLGDELLKGTFDRCLLARGGDGRVARAEVIDFKSDRLDGSEAELARRIEFYRPQLEAYRTAMASIAGLAAERVECRLAFLEDDLVVDLAPS